MSRIPQSFVDDLLNRLDIVEVIDSRVKLRRTGKNYVACCPFHKEKTPSFTVSPDKQFYYCFGCGASGTALGFVIEYEHLGFVDAVEALAASAGLSVPRETALDKPKAVHKNLYEILQQAKAYYQTQLAEHPQRNQAVDYLKGRGLTGQVAKAFGLGYAPPGWDNLLIKLGLTEEDRELLKEAGMFVTHDETGRLYDRFRHRIMFPILDSRGRTIGFGGRILENKSQAPAAGPKYLNSPETPVFHKGKELYGLFQALQHQRRPEYLLVVEGYMDVIALAQYGLHQAVATLGTACGEDHLNLAFRHTHTIVFCFDGDNAGRKAARRALENALPALSDGRKIQFLFLPEGQDPDSLVRQVGADRFNAQIQQAMPLENFFFQAVTEGIDSRTLEGRASISKLASPLLNKLPTGVFRELMFNQLAQNTGLPLDVLMGLIHAPAQLTQVATPISVAPIKPMSRAKPFVKPEVIHPKAHQLKLSPATLALTLLLENPMLRAALPSELNLPNDPQNIELVQLNTLLDLLLERPQMGFHGILGYWGGTFGTESQKQLTQKVAHQFLGEVKQKSSDFDAAQELKDALARLRQEFQLRQAVLELEQIKHIENPSALQLQRIKELLMLQVQAKNPPSE